jgi:hypothetical protein
MPWYSLTLDEVEYTAEQTQKLKIEPMQKVTAMLDAVISSCLESLGVDCTMDDESIAIQQQALDINVVELTPPQLQFLCEVSNRDYNPDSLGYYIYQNLDPIFFIPDPHLNSEGKVVVEFYSFKSDIVVQLGTLKIPLKV